MAPVTGGARGIGKAIALRLAQAGANVAIVDLTDSGVDTAREIAQATGRATTFCQGRRIQGSRRQSGGGGGRAGAGSQSTSL